MYDTGRAGRKWGTERRTKMTEYKLLGLWGKRGGEAGRQTKFSCASQSNATDSRLTEGANCRRPGRVRPLTDWCGNELTHKCPPSFYRAFNISIWMLLIQSKQKTMREMQSFSLSLPTRCLLTTLLDSVYHYLCSLPFPPISDFYSDLTRQSPRRWINAR